MKLFRVFFCLFGVAALGMLAGCATTTGSSTSAAPDPNVLRVGIAPELPPLAFKSGGEFKGVEPDLARALAADLGRQVRFVELRWDQLVDALLDNRVDIIMSGMTITRERQMRINFTKPYMRSGQSVLVRRSDVASIQMNLFNEKTRVGAQKATTGDFWVRENCARAQRKLFSSASQGARAVASKQIDAFICDAPVNWWLASENETSGLTVVGGYLTEEYLGWGVRRDNAGLLAAANRFLDEKRASGELDAMLRTWIPFK